MLLPRLQLLLLAANTAFAFKDTSPFLLVSSDPLSKDAPLQSVQLALTQDVEDRLIDTLSACDKQAYYIVSQENVRASDWKDGAMPKLQERLGNMEKSHVVQIPEVVVMGQLSAASVAKRMDEVCSARGKKNVLAFTGVSNEFSIDTIVLLALPASEGAKAKAMKDADDTLEQNVFGKSGSSVLIYITSPPARSAVEADDSQLYEMDDPYPSGLHNDLKRNMAGQKRQADGNLNMQKGLPLFETYQFLSPALFMTFGVSVLLLILLYVGISAVAGLEVSYAAFSKEMGPQAQKVNKQS